MSYDHKAKENPSDPRSNRASAADFVHRAHRHDEVEVGRHSGRARGRRAGRALHIYPVAL